MLFRSPFPVLRQEDTLQLGMPQELDPVEIVRFTLVPVGRAPDVGDAGDSLAVVATDLDGHEVVRAEGIEVVDDVETRRPPGRF